MIEPGPVRDAVLNWDAVVPTLLERARREAVGGVLDPDTATRIDWLRSRADVTAVLSEAACAPPTVPVLDVQCSFQSRQLNFFSVVSTIGTPLDVTAQELRLEAFFPVDDATRAAWIGP